jgi:DNA topoisomerase-3
MLKLLCAVAKRHVYEDVTAQIGCGGHTFTAKGKTILDHGWKHTEARVKTALQIGNVKKDGEENDKTLNVTEGQAFENCGCRIAEHWTSPPKHYTEDTLLSAMETAGNANYTEGSDVEKKGLGTPATRAAIIETLIGRAYVARSKKQLLITEKGSNLIKIVPDSIKSAKLTAEWETVLQKIAKGEANAGAFMSEITEFTKNLVGNVILHPIASADAGRGATTSYAPRKNAVIIGKCPQCGGTVTETPKAYSCGGGRGECKFLIWKTMSSRSITEAQVKKLLANGKSDKILKFKSKAGKEFNATLIIIKDGATVTVGFDYS